MGITARSIYPRRGFDRMHARDVINEAGSKASYLYARSNGNEYTLLFMHAELSWLFIYAKAVKQI